MNESQSRQAFLDTILAEPDVESHRLIFADWLEEHGDLKKAEGLRTLPGLAGIWSSDWGKDQFGLWCSFTLESLSQRMRWISPGSFRMGSLKTEAGHKSDEAPRHKVTLTEGFWLADTSCTQEMWQSVMNANPCRFKGPRLPVEMVSWNDCQDFFARVNERIPGLTLTLPTEAQWEYACRAGTKSMYYADDLDSIAWYRANSEDQTHPVGEKQPNPWGLYDALGNVYEWCLDALRSYGRNSVVDPVVDTTTTTIRVVRGGCWIDGRGLVRAAYRARPSADYFSQGVGFRCACA